MLGRFALSAQLRVTQHFLNRHAGRFKATQKLDPDKNRRVINALARTVAWCKRQQPDAFVVSNRVGREACMLRDLTYFHGCALNMMRYDIQHGAT